MRVVALQSPDAYQGLTTDDGAVTGEVTPTGSLGLIAFVTIVGALGGVVYAAVRSALPERRRPAVWGLVCGVVVGSIGAVVAARAPRPVLAGLARAGLVVAAAGALDLVRTIGDLA